MLDRCAARGLHRLVLDAWVRGKPFVVATHIDVRASYARRVPVSAVNNVVRN